MECSESAFDFEPMDASSRSRMSSCALQIEAGAQSRLGWLPVLSLVASLGLVLVALADASARQGCPFAQAPFWAGLLLLYVPAFARLASSRVSRTEGLGLVIVLALALYLVRVMHTPLAFVYHDEFAHWRTVIDINQTQHLFGHNPILPVTALYPGLANVTVALSSTTGLPVPTAGFLVIGAGRLVLAPALFFFFEQISRSPRTAAMASLLYMANPNYLFFDAQFAYESLALPFAALILYLLARRTIASSQARVGLTAMAITATGALVVTHHLTAYALLGFLVLWGLAAWNARIATPPGTPGMILLVALACLAWFVYVATPTVGYLTYTLLGGVTELVRLIAGEQISRQLFRSFEGQAAPLWEQLSGYASVLIVLLGLPGALRWLWRTHRKIPPALALAVVSLAYPASLALRLVQRGAEISNRTSEFLYIAIALVLAIGVAEALPGWKSRWVRTSIVTGLATVLFVGGVVVGRAPWLRLPGSYLVGADVRSIDQESASAADWSLAILGQDNRFVADRSNGLLLGSRGEQHLITKHADGIPVANVFFARQLGAEERDILRRGGVRYLLVDHRLSTGLPLVGIYFEQGEPDTFQHTSPIDHAVLEKFDGLKDASRVFDSGDIVIYDVGAISGAN